MKAANSSPLGRRNGCAVLSMQGSEKALLQHLLARLHALRPDVLVGHNLGAGDLPLLLQRLQHNKVQTGATTLTLSPSVLTVPCLPMESQAVGCGAVRH